MVIDLSERECQAVLRLVERTAAKTLNPYWQNIAKKINIDLQAQINGGFFQCSACTDQESPRCLPNAQSSYPPR